jgi:hypothetical protein
LKKTIFPKLSIFELLIKSPNMIALKKSLNMIRPYHFRRLRKY